ncbi:hypothetical protein GCM10008929_14470 [Alkalibacterium psychrotolerans]
MRNKIKQMMNKEEGFTLVELLAVIVILGIIVAISIPAIGGVISNAQDNADSAEQDLIEEAARMWHISERDGKGSVDVGVKTLIDGGYLENRGDDDLSGGVKIDDSGNTTTFEYNSGISVTAPGI